MTNQYPFIPCYECDCHAECAAAGCCIIPPTRRARRPRQSNATAHVIGILMLIVTCALCYMLFGVPPFLR
jgi:hypothetical protein